MQTRFLPLALALLAAARGAAAGENPPPEQLDTVVVTATRTDTPLREVGSNVTVITSEEIARRQLNSVADILRVVPGLDVLRNGGLGQTTSLFLRGAKSGQTLVLIDGIEANDPSSPDAQYDFANLMVDHIERIEVLRGGESALYGSDAMGGVINIITKKGVGAPKFGLNAEGGAYGQYKVGGASDGALGPVRYHLSASRLANQGISAAARELGNPERDRYRNTTLTAGLGADLAENFTVDWTLHFTNGHTHLDNCGGPFCDDPNYDSDSDQLFTRGQGKLTLLDGLWTQTFGVAYSLTARNSDNPFDLHNPFVSLGDFTGEKIKVSWQNDFHLPGDHLLTVGWEDEEDSMSSDFQFSDRFGSFSENIPRESMNTGGLFLQDRFDLHDRWFMTFGVRYDDNNRSGSKVTWRTSHTVAIDETGTRIKGNYGTGFKVPTLYQLFAPPTVLTIPGQDPIAFPALGNPDLSPERSRNWDIGLEQGLWSGRILLGATYFNNEFRDLIDVKDFSKGFENVARASAHGLETFWEIRPLEELSLRGSYTYQETEQESTAGDPAGDAFAGKPLLRRPRHKGSFDAAWQITEDAKFNLNVLLVGPKDDLNFSVFPAQRITLPGYVLVNLAGQYRVSEQLHLYARIDNLLDKSYQEIYGYGTAGVAGYGGFQLSF